MGIEHGHDVDKYGGSEWSGVDQVHCMEGKIFVNTGCEHWTDSSSVGN
jgi:hypothetical protein